MRVIPLLPFLLGTVAPAQTAWFRSIERGCNGSPVAHCVRQNDTAPVLPLATPPATYAYAARNTGGTTIQVVGVELFVVNHLGATETVGVAVFLDAAGPGATAHSQPAAGPVALGALTVTPHADWRAAGLAPAVSVPPGGAFWIVHEAYRGCSVSHDAGGARGPAGTWSRVANGAWTPTPSFDRAAFRVSCTAPTPAVPYVVDAGPPRLGQVFTIRVADAVPGAVAFALLGTDRVSWAGRSLPFDLAPLGAPSCIAYASADDALPLVLDARGSGTRTLTIPSDPRLAGRELFVQFAVRAPRANALGLVVSNLGAGVLGS
ncbi:MAG: hypothetical protein IPM29_31845 [Planctomycetes bacterium]|nr:hypothetical protein [Planctomycetota bacterium]